MKNGDVIVQINDLVIKNIEEYMKGLATLEKGKIAKVKVLRDGKEMIFDVQL